MQQGFVKFWYIFKSYTCYFLSWLMYNSLSASTISCHFIGSYFRFCKLFIFRNFLTNTLWTQIITTFYDFFLLSLIFKMATKMLLETNFLYLFITLSYFYHQVAWVWYLGMTRYTEMLWPFDDSCWLKRGIWSKAGNRYQWVYCKTKILICTRQYCCDLQWSVLAFPFTKGFVCRARGCQCYPRNKRRLKSEDSYSW